MGEQSNQCMGSGCIQIWNRNTTVESALHLKSDVDRLYIKRKEGGRGLMSVELCVKENKNSLGFCGFSSEDNLIRGAAGAETTNTEYTVASGEFEK